MGRANRLPRPSSNADAAAPTSVKRLICGANDRPSNESAIDLLPHSVMDRSLLAFSPCLYMWMDYSAKNRRGVFRGVHLVALTFRSPFTTSGRGIRTRRPPDEYHSRDL
jgi:hypothetical protein